MVCICTCIVILNTNIHLLLDGQPILASASANGHIALWDLNNNGRLIHIVRGAHDRAVTAIEWVPGQPVLVSSGEDNSVKVSQMIAVCLINVDESNVR